MCKPRIYSENEEEKVAVSHILNHVFGSSLKLLHPFMPFVTAEIYSKLICFGTEDIIVSKWPTIRSKFVFDDEEEAVEKLKEVIVGIRNLRSTKNIHPSKKAKLIIVTAKYKKAFEEAKEILQKLGYADEIIVVEDKESYIKQVAKKESEDNLDKINNTKLEDTKENAIVLEELNSAMSIILSDVEVYMPLKGLIDLEEERTRLAAEVTRLEAEVARGEKMLSNPGFISKAPEAKVNEEKEKLAKYKEMLALAKERLEKLFLGTEEKNSKWNKTKIEWKNRTEIVLVEFWICQSECLQKGTKFSNNFKIIADSVPTFGIGKLTYMLIF